MSNRLRKVFGTVALPIAAALIVVGLPAFHARRICDNVMRAEIAPLPHYRSRFAFYPDHHIAGVDHLGFKPGWLVTYAPRSKAYGTAFCVSFFGKILASGTPRIVEKMQVGAQEGIEKFQRAFAELDAAVPVGTTLSAVIPALGEPVSTFTNDDGTVHVDFVYTPRELGSIKIDWLTNGFTFIVSNDVIVMKTYSYMSSR